MKVYRIWNKLDKKYVERAWKPRSIWRVFPGAAIKSWKLDSVNYEVHEFEIKEPIKKYYIDKTEIK